MIFEWWTDLSGTGYVGKNLKSITRIGEEGEKIMVKTRWRMMRMNLTLLEKLSLLSEDHWVWEPHVMGIDIADDFRLGEVESGKVRLTITSTMKPAGAKGKLMRMVMGGMLDRIMSDEWKAADRAFREEIKSKSG